MFQPETVKFQSPKMLYFVINDFFLFKKRAANLQNACNICAEFQIDCLKTVGGVELSIVY